MLKKIFNYIIIALTHNKCDTCGFTKDEVYVTEFYSEGGCLQCKKCINEEKYQEWLKENPPFSGPYPKFDPTYLEALSMQDGKPVFTTDPLAGEFKPKKSITERYKLNNNDTNI